MCSWCWGFSSTLQALITALAEKIEFRRLLGGLAADTDEPMSEQTRAMVRSNWQRIEEHITGIKFNFDFWEKCQPRRSTYPACRAVLAARQQDREEDMIKAIQSAYYEQARNPSDDSVLLELASELALDMERFSADLHAPTIQQQLEAEIAQARDMFVESYPALVLREGNSEWRVPIDYNDPHPMLEFIESCLMPGGV